MVTAVLLVISAVVTVATSFPEGVGSTVVRVAFVSLWLSLPWLATEGVTHLAVRSGAAGTVVRLASGAAWVGACALWGGLTPVLLGDGVDPGWGLAGGAVGGSLLVVTARLAGRRRAVPRPEEAAHLRGPFLDH